MRGAAFASLSVAARLSAEERRFWAGRPLLADSMRRKVSHLQYGVVASEAGTVRLRQGDDVFDAPEAVWEAYGRGDRKALYDCHLEGRAVSVWGVLPAATEYTELGVSQSGKAVMLRADHQGREAHYWCPVGVWDDWLGGSRRAAKWFRENCLNSPVRYRPWKVRPKTVDHTADPDGGKSLMGKIGPPPTGRNRASL